MTTVKIEPMDFDDPSVFEFAEKNVSNLEPDNLNKDDNRPDKGNGSGHAPTNVLDRIKFTTLFKLKHGEKKDAIDWCMQIGLISSTYKCPKCGMSMKLREKKGISDGYEWTCRTYNGKDGHTLSRSIRRGSWFSKSKMNICDILMITHCWVYRLPHEWVRIEMSCSQATTCDWFSFCRDICKTVNAMTMIGGKCKTVEIEETLFQRKRYKGEDVEGVYVLGGVEKGSTKCFFTVIENRTSDNLLEVIKSHILPGTKIISHCWDSYSCLEDKIFVDSSVDDEYTFDKPDTGSYVTFGGIWRALKNFVPIFVDNFDAYLAEYTWRKNNSYAYDKMKCFIEAVKVVFPAPTADICE